MQKSTCYIIGKKNLQELEGYIVQENKIILRKLFLIRLIFIVSTILLSNYYTAKWSFSRCWQRRGRTQKSKFNLLSSWKCNLISCFCLSAKISACKCTAPSQTHMLKGLLQGWCLCMHVGKMITHCCALCVSSNSPDRNRASFMKVIFRYLLNFA